MDSVGASYKIRSTLLGKNNIVADKEMMKLTSKRSNFPLIQNSRTPLQDRVNLVYEDTIESGDNDRSDDDEYITYTSVPDGTFAEVIKRFQILRDDVEMRR